MATQDITQLVVEVQSKGILTASNQLDKLAAASDKAEAAVKKLGTVIVTTQGSTATAQAQAEASGVNSAADSAQKMIAIAQKRDYELYRIRSAEAARLSSIQEKRDIEEYTAATAQALAIAAIQQKRDTEIYESRVAEAARLKAIQERRDVEEYTMAQEQAMRIKAIQEKRDIEIYTERVEAAAKLKAIQEKRDMEEYTAAQSEAARIKAIEEKRDIELYEMRVASNARLLAEEEKQRRMNAAFQTASISSQIRTATEAQAYATLGGNATARFGSAAATADITALTAEQRRLAAATAAARAEQNAQNVALAEAHALARGLSGSLGALWVTYGNLAGMAVGIAIGASLKGVISVGKDVENTLESIRVLGGATTEEVSKMSAAIQEFGKGTQGPKDVAEALQVLTMAGLSAKDALTGVEAALNLSVAGGVSIEKSAETLVQVGTALGYTADGYNHVADVIAKAAAVSMSSVDSISGAFKSAAAVGEVYGASLQDIAVGLAAVANLGIQGTAAGTALKNFYKDLSASTQKVSTTLKAMGMSIESFRDNSTGAFIPLIDVVKKLDAGLSTLTPKARAMAEVKLFGQQGVREGAILLSMLHQTSTMVDEVASKAEGKTVLYANKLEEMRGEIQKAAGFSTLAAIAMAQTTSNQMKSVGNTIQTVFVDVFNEVAPMIGEIARSLKAAFSSQEFKSGLSTTVSLVTSFTKAVTENLDVLKYLASYMALVKFAEFAVGIKAAAAAFDIAAISAKGFWSSLGPIGIAIAALTIAWQTYKEYQDRALNNTAAANNLQEYLNNVQKAADKEKQLADLRSKGLSDAEVARQQQMSEDAKASDAAIANSKKGTDAMLADLRKQWDALSDNEKARANMIVQGKTQFGSRDTTKYVESLNAYNAAMKVQKKQVDDLKSAEQKLFENHQKNDAYDDAKAKANRVVSKGENELPGKATSDADKYARDLAVFQGQIKAANQDLTGYREQEDAAFKAGQIGRLQLINAVADKEIETYKKVATASREQMAIAAKHVDKDGKADKTADVERYKDAADRADADAAQAEKMRRANTLAAEREMQTQITSLKIKSLEDQGKFVEAANLKWSADGKTAWMQAAADAAATGNSVAKDFLAAQDTIKQTSMNAAQLKQDSAAFDTSLLQLQGTLKGFKSETYGKSISGIFDEATKQSKDFDEQLQKTKDQSYQLMADAYDSPDGLKKYAEANKNIAAMVDKQKAMWQQVGDTIAKSLGDAFGSAGKALGGLYKATLEYQNTENATAEDRAKQYGDMAQAASGFFDKQSKGYRALNGIAQVFHVAQMARTLAQTAASVAAGAAQFFAESGWGGFAGVAAMGTVMAGLGYAMSGASAHGANSQDDAEYVQKNQGTGTVFGATDAKSKSISDALDSLKSNSDATLPLTQGMANSLKNIEDSMKGLANLAIRQGVANGSNFNVQTGTLQSGAEGIVGKLASLTASIPVLGGLVGKVASLWGKTSQEITDSGLQFGGSVAGLEAGQGFNQYANVKTTSSSWFGLSKSSSNSVMTQGVSDDISRQFGLVFTNLEDALKGAAGALGTNSDAVGKAIDNVVLQTTKISLKDLKGQDLTDAINNVLSAAMDQIAKTAYPQMEAFQQVGEGYAQTVVRVASGVEQANSALEKFGITAVNLADVQDKQGDVAFELTKQSILAKEGVSGIADMLKNMTGTVDDLTTAYKALNDIRNQMNQIGLNGNGVNLDVVKGAGGTSQLQTALNTYQDKYFTDEEKNAILLKSVTAEFNKLGVALPTTRSALRALVEAASQTNPLLSGQLLALVGDYDKLMTSAEAANKTTSATLQTTVDGLTKFRDALKSLKDSLALGDLSPLTPMQKFLEAKRQYEETVQKAAFGDTTAKDNVSSAAQAYLAASKTVNASSQGYTDSYNQVLKDIDTLGNLTDGNLTNADKQLAALQDVSVGIGTMSKASPDIVTDLNKLASAPSVPVSSNGAVAIDTSALEAEVKDLKQQLADAQAANAQALANLTAALFDSQAQNAATISDAVKSTATDTAYVQQTMKNLNTER